MLKSILVSIIVMLACSKSLFSQEFEGGAMLGITTSQVNGDGVGGFYKFGATAGFFIERRVSANLQGIYELRYASKGSKDGIGTMEIDVKYIEIPILVRYSKKNSHVGFKAGIAPAVKVYEKTEVNYFGSSSSDFWKWDVPIHLGFDYDLSNNTRFDLRYSVSPIPISYHYRNLCVYFSVHRFF